MEVDKKKELKIVDWSKHIKYNPNSSSITKESAWSEDDRSKIQRICKYLNEAKKYYADITEVRECIEWLQSIQDRAQPQNTWKPSEEQLNNILDVLSFDNCTPKRQELLISLYEQLKKLK